jgi:hypothetical protein
LNVTPYTITTPAIRPSEVQNIEMLKLTVESEKVEANKERLITPKVPFKTTPVLKIFSRYLIRNPPVMFARDRTRNR